MIRLYYFSGSPGYLFLLAETASIIMESMEKGRPAKTGFFILDALWMKGLTVLSTGSTIHYFRT